MKKFLVIVLVLLLVVGAVGIVTPTDYDVQKSVVVQATPAQVHAFVGDLKQWPSWTPWADHDPDMVITYGELSTGVGAHQSWSSKDGDGELTFTKCDPKTGIAYGMEFIQDGERVPATSAMTYRVVDGGTEITWTMAGDWKGAVPPVMDGIMKLLTPWMIGGDFDKGLGKLKQVVEAKA